MRKDPKNVDLWLEFVQFQEEIYRFDGTKPRKLIERKISIVKKAIEFNSNELQLILLHLRLADEIEDSATLMKLWESYLKRADGIIEYPLTVEWLIFLQIRFLAFSFDQVNEAFAAAFRKLQDPALYRLYFNFLNRCGYTERIIAISQAVIEVNIEYFNYGEVDLDAYDDQWESGLMDHIGDYVFHDLQKPNSYENVVQDTEIDLLRWIKTERYRGNHFWHPLHFDEDDYEGQVMFDDVKDFLVIPKNQLDSLSIINTVLVELGNSFFNHNLKEFKNWYLQVHKKLFPFFKTDWKFIYRFFVLMPLDEVKNFLSANRDSLECFLAYGKLQESIGNQGMASKVFESIKKRSNDFDLSELAPQFDTISEPVIELGNDLKSSVYNLVRSNPGNKSLYMRIIEATAVVDYNLAIEIFNLMEEQQLRIHTLLEEIEI